MNSDSALGEDRKPESGDRKAATVRVEYVNTNTASLLTWLMVERTAQEKLARRAAKVGLNELAAAYFAAAETLAICQRTVINLSVREEFRNE